MRQKGKTERLRRQLRTYSWAIVVVWTTCIALSLFWNLSQEGEKSTEVAHAAARITFENDVLYRRWNAKQGGVYVPVSEQTPPNPYLVVPDRDVITTSGLALTLVNPAYMTRQVNEMSRETGSHGHITSLRPIRPENAPDAWEAASLHSFEHGVKEVSSVAQMNGGEYLRLMRPFVAETACLKCHAVQGYREGDIRGGISVSVPLAPLRAIERQQSVNMVLAHTALWLIGLIGMGFSMFSLEREMVGWEAAEAALRNRVERYELVMAGSSGGIWDWDVLNKRTEFSFRWKEMRGLADHEVSGREEEWLSRVHSEDAPRVFAAVQAHLEGRAPVFHEEYRVQRKDGSWMWIADRGLAQRDGSGRVIRMAGSETDISGRKKAEEALQKALDELEVRVQERTLELGKSNELLEQMFSTTRLLIAYLDKDFNFIRVNRAYAEADYLSPEFFAGKNHFTLYPNNENQAIFRQVVETGEPYTVYGKPFTYADHPERGVTYWDWSVQPVREPEGEIGGLVLSLLNVTERVHAEQSLRDNEALLSTVLETLPVGVWIIDKEGSIVHCNPAGEKIWEGSRYVGIDRYGEYKGFWIHSGKTIRPEEWAGARAIREGETTLDEEIEIECFDGSRKVVLNSAVPTFNAEKKITGAVVIEQDITGRRAVEAEYRALRADLAHQNRLGALGAFAAGLAHEINQPLAAILSNAQAALRLLSGERLDVEEAREALSDIVNDDKRAVEVILRLRALYRKEEPNREDFNLNTVIGGVINLLRSEAIMRGVTLIENLDRTIPPISGDVVQIQQVILNIMQNAMDAVRERPADRRTLVIKTLRDGDTRVGALFHDSGPGIALEKLSSIFEPFITTKADGSGLGLAICRSIIQSHQGRIGAENHPDGGAVFSFWLPISSGK